jgi:hypothetical protein
MSFWKRRNKQEIDAKSMTPTSFEAFTLSLYNIPETKWGKRRKAISKLITQYQSLYPKKVEFIRPEYEKGKFYTIIKFSIESETYVYFEDITSMGVIPRINWFQLEKQDKSFGNDMLRTTLLLSSDNDAKTQGSLMLMLFDKMQK